MELRHLRYFVSVAEYRNFTRAAEHNFVAQSALSQQIGRLERELGAPLFARDKHSVDLTPAGRLLLPHAQRILADAARAQAELRAYLGLEAGQLHIGLIQTITGAVDVLDPLSRFHERYPAIEVHTSTQPSEVMIHAVAEGTLDLAVVGFGPDTIPAGLEARLLAVSPLVGIVCERGADGLTGPLSVAELLALGPLISFSRGTGLHTHVREALSRAGTVPNARFELGQAEDMIRYAAHGLGVTIVPRPLADSMASDAALPAYRIFELDDREAVQQVTVIYHAARLSASAAEFLTMLLP